MLNTEDKDETMTGQGFSHGLEWKKLKQDMKTYRKLDGKPRDGEKRTLVIQKKENAWM